MTLKTRASADTCPIWFALACDCAVFLASLIVPGLVIVHIMNLDPGIRPFDSANSLSLVLLLTSAIFAAYGLVVVLATHACVSQRGISLTLWLLGIVFGSTPVWVAYYVACARSDLIFSLWQGTAQQKQGRVLSALSVFFACVLLGGLTNWGANLFALPIVLTSWLGLGAGIWTRTHIKANGEIALLAPDVVAVVRAYFVGAVVGTGIGFGWALTLPLHSVSHFENVANMAGRVGATASLASASAGALWSAIGAAVTAYVRNTSFRPDHSVPPWIWPRFSVAEVLGVVVGMGVIWIVLIIRLERAELIASVFGSAILICCLICWKAVRANKGRKGGD